MKAQKIIAAINSRVSEKGATTPLPSIEEVSKKDENTDAIKDTANAASENLLQKDDQLECMEEKEISAENKETAKPESMEAVVSKKEIAAKNKKTAIPGPVKRKSTLKKDTVTKRKRGAAMPMLSTNPAFSEEVSDFFEGITTLDIDAIVNAANKTLQGGGGASSRRRSRISKLFA